MEGREVTLTFTQQRQKTPSKSTKCSWGGMPAFRRWRQEDHEFAFRWSTQQDPIPPPPKVSKNRRESKKVWWVLTDRASQKKSPRQTLMTARGMELTFVLHFVKVGQLGGGMYGAG